MTEMTPTVTVLIATYNKAKTLGHVIESVLWQTFEDFELWVIGDGCTDNTEEVVKAFDDPRIGWYNLPHNSGYQSEPHNEGLRRARGRYIAYLNHDDIWFPNHLQVLVEHIENRRADLVYSIIEWIMGYKENYADIPSYPNAPRPPEASATLHRASFIDEFGYWKTPYKTRAIPRAEYFRRAQFAGKRFELVPMLTALKFVGDTEHYSGVGPQAEYMETIRRDPLFAHRELATLLANAYHQLEKPPQPRLFVRQIGDLIRRKLVSRRIDPASLHVWQAPGAHIRKWRLKHKLDTA